MARGTYTNCVIVGNTTRRNTDNVNSPIRGGGGMFNNQSAPMLIHVTICDNTAVATAAVSGTDINFGLDSGGIYNYADNSVGMPLSAPQVISSIIWDNTGTDGIVNESAYKDGNPPIINPPNFPMIVTYSNVQGSYFGTGNISLAPNLSGAFPWAYRITGAPCVDAGNSSLTSDILGVARPIGANPDMGAYEYSPTNPVAQCKNVSVTLDSNCSATLGANSVDDGSTAEAGILNMTLSQSTFSGVDIPSKSVIFTVTDQLGRQDSCTATVTVTDFIPPVITTCPANQTLDANANCQITIPDLTNLLIASDNCGIATKAQAPVAGTVVSVDTEVTLTVYDVGGNSASCKTWIYLNDITPPQITLNGAASVNVECGSTYVDAGATATDSCDGVISGNITVINPVNTSSIGVYTVTYNVKDSSNNSAVAVTRTVNVVDTTAPVITSCPSDQTLNLDANCEVVIPNLVNQVIASDSCGLVGTAVQNPVAGTVVSEDTPVTFTVTDGGNNTAHCQATIYVQDLIAPVIVLNGSDQVQHQLGDVYSDPGVVITDNCDSSISAVVGGDTVDVNTIGDYTITYDASDMAGNAATQLTRLVRVRDTQNPYLTAVEVIDGWTVAVTFNKAMGSGVSDAINYSLSGSGQGTLTAQPDSVVLDTGNTYLLSWPVCGISSSQEMFNGGDITITVAVLVEDYAGNTMDVAGNVLTDTGSAMGEAPQILACADDQSLELDDNCEVELPDLTDEIVVSDNCSADDDLIITQDPAAGTMIDSNTNVTLWVEDEAGNESQCVVPVTVFDATPPTITSYPASDEAALDGNCTAMIPSLISEVVAEDNCTAAALLQISQDPASGTAITEDTVVTITVTDESGNDTQVQSQVQVVDKINPVVTISGNNPLTVECTEPITLPIASATDNCDTSLLIDIAKPQDLDLDTPAAGSYNVIYSTEDSSENVGTATLVINVTDTKAPVVTITGPSTVVFECGEKISALPEASALDACEGNLTTTISDFGGLDTDNPEKGDYVLTYAASDSVGNTGTDTLDVEIVDTKAPIITRTGAAFVYVNLGDSYTDAGATASDTCDGDLTANIVTVNPVDINEIGFYQVTYDVTDSEGLVADQVVRDIYVGDITEPDLIAVAVDNTLEIWVTYNRTMREDGDNGVLNPENYTLSGSGQGTFNAVPDSVTAYGSLNRYVLAWSRPDEMFNAGDIIITVNPNVEDSEGKTMRINVNEDSGGALGDPPVITLNAGDETLECSIDEFTEAGATAVDNVDGTVSVVITGDTVNDQAAGTYVVNYEAVDAAGNMAYASRTVAVEDTLAPEIELMGAEALTLECGDPYEEAGVDAFDACDGDLSQDVIAMSSVDVGQTGPQTILYTVEDSMGNSAQIERVVTVEDTTAPIITLLGNNPEVLIDGADYVEAGASAWDACEGDLSAFINLDGDVANTNALAVYEVTYSLSDSFGNAAEATRSVIVKPLSCLILYSLVVTPNPVLLDANVTLSAEPLPESCSIGTLHYSWMKDGVVIPDAPDAFSWTLHKVGFEDAGAYVCMVSDSSSTAATNSVVLVVEKGVPAVGLIGLMVAAAAIAAAATRRKQR
ncbi:MAG: immunoglobulin-like domain-containing protein [Candidatus Hydrogenedentales bacterium]